MVTFSSFSHLIFSDDNNTNPDDGCNACKITPGYSCSGQPSVCQGRYSG
jgi:hypothetical protein